MPLAQPRTPQPPTLKGTHYHVPYETQQKILGTQALVLGTKAPTKTGHTSFLGHNAPTKTTGARFLLGAQAPHPKGRQAPKRCFVLGPRSPPTAPPPPKTVGDGANKNKEGLIDVAVWMRGGPFRGPG